MANIRKQFNFRNGVQVDDDNLVVSPTGLVGIGTTIPTEALDVRGTAKVVGLVTASQIYTPNLTAENVNITTLVLGDSVVGGGVSIRSGIVTASGTGIVTYYGDGGRLLNLPTSQWLDVDAGLGFTSIYAQGYVGVGTNDPRFLFQVSGNNSTTLVGFTSGVGFSSEGNILATGIVTAYKFVGVGSNLTGLNASNIEYGTISLNRIPTIPDTKLSPSLNLNNVTIGVLTATTLNSGVHTTTSLTVSGNATIGGNVSISGSLVATATTALGLTGTPNIQVGVITASSANIPTITSSLITGNLTGIANTARDLVNESTVTITSISAGVGTFSTKLVSEQIGIGTTVPAKDLTLRRTNNAEIQVISDTGSSIISFGRSESTAGWNGALRFGNTSGLFDYSTEYSVDLLNYGKGNINFYLEVGDVGINTGSFYWHRRTTERLMTLTYEGKLGIGKTNPNTQLDVVGVSSISGDSSVGGDFSVVGNSVFSGNVTINGDFNTTGSISLPGTIVANLQGNVNATSGLSTFTNIYSTNFIGIRSTGNTAAINPEVLSINSPGSAKIFVDVAGNLGIKTTVIATPGLNGPQLDCLIAGVGIGTTRPRCAIDFSFATNTSILGENRDTIAYILPPKLTTTQRNNLTNIDNSGVETGALIYNIDNKRLELKHPDGWVGIATIP